MPVVPDIWQQLRAATTARLAMGRAGPAIPTSALLDFQLGFAKARDAVHAALDVDALRVALEPTESLHVSSCARDRSSFLMRPDLGRRLNTASIASLEACRSSAGYDLAFVIGDGLSAKAAHNHAPSIISHCKDLLADLTIAPVVIAEQARVALADHVAELLDARAVMILLGERPGLTTADSLGIYYTWQTRIGISDSSRNCISNIHGGGLGTEAAAGIATWLVRESMRLKLSGTGLKENISKASSVRPLTETPDSPGLPLGSRSAN